MRRALLLALVPVSLYAQSQTLTLEAITAHQGVEGPRPTQIRFSPDGRLLTYILEREGSTDRDLWAVEMASGAKRVLLSHDQLASLAPAAEQATDDERERERLLRYAVASFIWSPDSKKLLFVSSGQLYLYELETERTTKLAPAISGVRDPQFSPDGRQVAFVHAHDLWLVPAAGGEPVQLTRGGGSDLRRGEPDWVYEEEFELHSAYAWSPDSRQIAFWEFDESPVLTYPITDLVPIDPGFDLQRYPKAGDPNPHVRIGVVAAKPGAKPRWLDVEAEYIPRLAWAGDGRLAIQTLNRAQTELELLSVEVQSGRKRTLLVERDERWINLTDDLRFLDDGKSFLWTSERSGWRHIYRYSGEGGEPQPLTSGEWEVATLDAVDEDGGWVYFSANEANPLGLDLYRVRLDGSGLERLTGGDGTNRAKVSVPGSAYAVERSSLSDPGGLWLSRIGSSDSTPLVKLNSLEKLGLVEPELRVVEAEGGAVIRMLLLDPHEKPAGERLPLLLYVYGGPHRPTIRDAWGGVRYLFHQYLLDHGYVVVQVDDRASSVLSHGHEAALYRNYGMTALDDHLAAVEELRKIPSVDPNRVGIWGWSGGGFAAAMALTHSKAFRAGIAGAPVTDWRLYDSVYTERYMGLPAENEEAYDRNSAVKAAENLHGQLLLVHGTADDNVHFQNSVRMIDALIQAGKPYDLAIYPGKTHGIRGEKQELHLYRTMFEFLERHLKGADQVADR